jgi:pectin methylesterase-like acyl-CoA thioesterase
MLDLHKNNSFLIYFLIDFNLRKIKIIKKKMSTIYSYFTGALVDIGVRVGILNSKIAIDLDLPSINYISTVYNTGTGNVDITFSAALNDFQTNVLNNLSTIILYDGTVQKDVYIINENTFNRRSFSTSQSPTNAADKLSGYSIGSVVTTTADEVFICVDDTVGSAVWEKVFPQEAPITLQTNNIDYHPTFVLDAATESQNLSVASGLSFNPSTNLLATQGAIRTPSVKLANNSNFVNLQADPTLVSSYQYTYPANAPTGNAQIMATLGLTNVFYDVHAENTVTVRKNPGPDEFSSIAAAIASITTASAFNLFIVNIDPGVYFEAGIVLKPYVSLVGKFSVSCVVVCVSPLAPLFTAVGNSSLKNLTLVTAGPPPPYMIEFFGDPNSGALYMDTITFISSGNLVHIASTLGPVLCLIRDTVIPPPAAITSAFLIEDGPIGEHPIQFLIDNVIWDTRQEFLGGFTEFFTLKSYKSPAATANIVGGISSAILGQTQTQTGTCIRIEGSVYLVFDSSIVRGFTNGILVPNTVEVPKLICSTTTFESNDKNINILSTTLDGYLIGFSEYIKTVLPIDTPFFISGKNQQIITVSDKGSDFTSIVAALDAITTNSYFTPFAIVVGPGVYTEQQIVCKPFVDIVGVSTQTVLLADQSLAGIPFIVGAGHSRLSSFTISPADENFPPSYLIECLGTPDYSVFEIDSLQMDSRAGIIHIGSSIGPIIHFATKIVIGATPLTRFYYIEDSGPYNYPIICRLSFLTWFDQGGSAVNLTDLIRAEPSAVGTPNLNIRICRSGKSRKWNRNERVSRSKYFNISN